MGHGDIDHQFDCIIIGGGFAGLAAAIEITQRSPLKLLVIEAQSRLGGRALTKLDGLPQPIDMGCSFIHGYHQGNPMAKIARELKVDVWVAPSRETIVIGSDGPLNSKSGDTILGLLDQCLEEVKERLAESTPELRNESLAHLITQHLESHHSGPDLENLLSLIQTLEVGAGIPLENVAGRYFSFHRAYSGTDGMPVGGFQKIVAAMADRAQQAGVRYILGEEVTKVAYDNQSNSVILETKKADSAPQIYRARACVSTIPLGVLKRNPPAFDPPLNTPLKLAIQSTSVGLLNKVVLVYQTAWWPASTNVGKFIFLAEESSHDDSLSTTCSLDQTLSRTTFWADILAAAGPGTLTPTLIVPFGASAAAAIERHNDEQVIQTLHKFLTRRLGVPASPPTAFLISRWDSNVYARGATSSPVSVTVDKSNQATPLDFITLSRPVWKGHLGFAGEHTHFDHRGSVAGAILSGRREAERVIQLLAG